MRNTQKPYEMIEDYITGKRIPNIGAEENRQKVERFLVENKGYAKDDIRVNIEISFVVKGEPYESTVDIVVSPEGKPLMAIKCAAGSLGSREKEILAAARIMGEYPVPYAISTDGETAHVIDTTTGKKIAENLDAIPSKSEALAGLDAISKTTLNEKQKEREMLIFRSYDSMNVNISKNIQGN